MRMEAREQAVQQTEELMAEAHASAESATASQKVMTHSHHDRGWAFGQRKPVEEI